MRITPIDLGAAPGASLVTNSMVSDPDLEDLDCDLVMVKLPGGLGIDVSWHPERERPGMYHVTVFPFGDWDNPAAEGEAATPEEAARMVERFAALWLNSCGEKP